MTDNKAMRWTIILLVLAGCGKGLDRSVQNAAEFQGYLASFKSEAAARGVATDGWDQLIIEEGDVTGGAAARCYRSSSTVIVSDAAWQRETAAGRELIMFHEFGHCLLGLGHAASGIMQAVVPSPISYSQGRTALLDALFKSPRD